MSSSGTRRDDTDWKTDIMCIIGTCCYRIRLPVQTQGLTKALLRLLGPVSSCNHYLPGADPPNP